MNVKFPGGAKSIFAFFILIHFFSCKKAQVEASNSVDNIKITTLETYGDSNTVGYALESPLTQAWPQLLGAKENLNVNNQAVSSSGCQVDFYQFLANAQYPNKNVLRVSQIGFNDLRYATLETVPPPRNQPQDVTIVNKVIAFTRTMLAYHFLKSGADASGVIKNPLITLSTSGTWGATPENPNTLLSLCPKMQPNTTRIFNGPHPLFSKQANSSLTWHFNNTNEDMAIGYLCTSDITKSGTIQVYLNGNLYKTINTNYSSPRIDIGWYRTIDYTLSPDCIIIPSAKTAGGNTVMIKLISGEVRLDYAGILQNSPDSVPPFILNTAIHMPTYQYINDYTTQDAIDNMNLNIEKLAREWINYPVSIGLTNNYYNPNDPAQVQADGIHMTALGQSNMVNADVTVVEPLIKRQ